MKKILVLLAFLLGSVESFDAVAARGGSASASATPSVQSGARGGGRGGNGTVTANVVSGGAAVDNVNPSTNSAVKTTARAAKQSGVIGTASKNTGNSGNSGTGSVKVGSRNKGGSTATVNTGSKQTARAAKQNVIVGGTKVASAGQNKLVDEECREKFDGCMDAFCMLENTSGGRCACSNKHKELNAVLAEIEKLDAQSYKMATVGVEKIEMGEDGDAIMAQTKAVTESLKNADEPKKNKRKSLNLDSWNTVVGGEDGVFDGDGAFSAVENKEGDALYVASYNMCSERMPECASSMTMLGSLYKQRIRSDCTAYENSLKQQKNASAQKLATAEAAMREAALEQYKNANKYDLGQCTVKFKECMKTTGGCGDDFSGCATVAAAQEAVTKKGTRNKKSKQTTIKGAVTEITIAAATYDSLVSKKPLCENVTKQCVSVRDKVWETFLREVAPELKSAELIAESNLRTSCIGNISACYQKACKDTMDPNDPDGSYDMCLSRPETLESFCKVEIAPCKAAEPRILDYVFAKLSAMRVDACTKEVKDCLQSEDRCGKDYVKCVGLDTTDIVSLCPEEKLTACYEEYEGKTTQTVQAALESKVQGILLNIDNSLAAACQKAADTAMIKVCGSTQDCDGLVVDDAIGTRAFKYEVCTYKNNAFTNSCRTSIDAITLSELQDDKTTWAGKLSGIIYWQNINYDVEHNKFTSLEEYITALQESGITVSNSERQVIEQRVFGSELGGLARAVEAAINTIESDPTVKACMKGKVVQGVNDKQDTRSAKADEGRFPNLTDSMRQTIAWTALKKARNNYMKKYGEEMERIMKEQVSAVERLDKDQKVNSAHKACIEWATSSTLPITKVDQGLGLKIAGGLVTSAAIVAAPFTGGASLGAAVLGATLLAEGANAEPIENWNYKENVSTMFNEATGECTKITRTQNCADPKPGRKLCKQWEDPQETTTSINLYVGE